ncbi:MAG TPA: NUDIX domain-containing protein [Streptosporangiaceae bacterium]|nr:NUDIX domain-containing protein [Streptosporangiaceae bacterium]
MKYFTEFDLRPLQGVISQDASPALLNERETEDLRTLAQDFTREGDLLVAPDTIDDKPHVRTFIMFLRALGALRVEEHSSNYRLRLVGRLAKHVPEILTIYLTGSLTLIDNWETLYLSPEDSLSALDLLRQMELRRIELTRRSGRRVEPLAVRPVAFAIFHALNKKGVDCYLFEVNKDWRRLNFIGGKQEPSDGGDFRVTVTREIAEELGIAAHRLTLTQLNAEPLEAYSLSGNVGSLASYPCVLYGVRVAGQLRTRPQDRWLTEQQIRSCRDLPDGPLMVNPVYLDFLLSGSPTRLADTPVSTSQRVRTSALNDIVPRGESPLRRWARVLGENKDLLVAIITLAAAVMTLFVAF